MTTTFEQHPRRRAIFITQEVDRLKAYLPANYEVAEVTPDGVIIEGEDFAGWTLDEYVIPRLASGLIFGREIVA